MASLLFYDNPVALNKETHQKIKVNAGTNDFSFAKQTNSVVLAGVEFTEAAKEYPIVFAEAGESMVPVALLGLRNEENLFIDDKNGWDARYVPAFVRRYPFVLATGEDATQQVVCIDESFSGFNDESGEALFGDDGEPAPLLTKALEFLEEYQKQYLRTGQFIQRLKENDLLQNLNAKVDLVNGQQFSLTGLLIVDEKKLLALSDESALAFFKTGELAWVYCHLMSLGNMSAMVDRIAKIINKVEEKVEEKGKAEAEAEAKK
ncbi:MAG: hypothetical protein ACJA2O_002804 [Candidatus Azotimanducaceae bacterium]|jgi:hypothetical protein